MVMPHDSRRQEHGVFLTQDRVSVFAIDVFAYLEYEAPPMFPPVNLSSFFFGISSG